MMMIVVVDDDDDEGDDEDEEKDSSCSSFSSSKSSMMKLWLIVALNGFSGDSQLWHSAQYILPCLGHKVDVSDWSLLSFR